jgi:ABC-2 type transport system permease protein
MGIDFKVASAIFRKDLRTYLANPTGYVFLTLFIATTAAAAFLQEGFFARNLADLAELNKMMPAILMFFVPAITMSAWADERRGGTDEILLTLPVRDAEVVIGKYLGVLGMYTVSLAFSVAHLFVLGYLGAPDSGLMMSTYFGYWLVGALFCAIGLLGSMFTANPTVAFILGALGCASLVVAGSQPWASGILGASLIGLLTALVWLVGKGEPAGAGVAGLAGAAVGVVLWQRNLWPGASAEDETRDVNAFVETFETLAVDQHFQSFGEGIIRLGDVLFFAGGVAVILYLCAFLLGRRHW